MFARNNLEGEDEFQIDLDSGNMTVKNGPLLDFETKKKYSFFVEARDNYRPNILSKKKNKSFTNFIVKLTIVYQFLAAGSNWEDQIVNITYNNII